MRRHWVNRDWEKRTRPRGEERTVESLLQTEGEGQKSAGPEQSSDSNQGQ